MTYTEQRDMAAKAIAKDIYTRIVGSPMPDDNPYESACNRMETATHGYHLIKAISEQLVELANDEYDKATANLRKHESQPGVALPEYRYPNGIPSAELA